MTGDMADSERTCTPDASILEGPPTWEEHLQALRRLRTETDRLIGDDPGPYVPLLAQLLEGLDSLVSLTGEAAVLCRSLPRYLRGAELDAGSGLGS